MQSAILNPKKISAIIAACSLAVAVQAQVIDPLTGSLAGYTTTPILENSAGAGEGISFTDPGAGLQNNYVGTATGSGIAEQGLFWAPASSFSTTFAVGKRLTVNVTSPTLTLNGSLTEDFGLAIAAATPIAAGAGNGNNSRTLFDWASISIRPDQQSIRANSSISGTLVTGNGVINSVPTANVSQLYIDWVSPFVFTMGYIDSSAVQHVSETITFGGASTIGTEIGFYGDLRLTGQSVGVFNNLALSTIPVPEPSTLTLSGMGLASLIVALRRKK